MDVFSEEDFCLFVYFLYGFVPSSYIRVISVWLYVTSYTMVKRQYELRLKNRDMLREF